MRATKVMQMLVLTATSLLGGCAGTPNGGADSTPSWLKHHVVGTRIPRVPDANGDASAAGYVINTTVAQLEDLPGVHVETCRGSFCRR